MLIGLCGAHRTGKTSLAKAYAQERGATFVETSVSRVFRELGYDPAVTYDFSTRLTIQEGIIEAVDEIYASVDPTVDAIADRTPLDMVAYTMAEAIGDRVSSTDQDRFAAYVQRCIDVTNKRFGALLLVQPGIEVVPEAGKAVANRAYMEHLNALILGLITDERIQPLNLYIPRKTVDMDGRVRCVRYARSMAVKKGEKMLAEHVSEGRFVH